ncbi:hypothetical protein VTK73DRAFT_6033 [Phialemonium thermophilum]|uniref:Uncharacterized protein n=1 Tax=Phialemonium thermophilum TaxID=223376 RepID=A0ABR3XX24_9PEZI
MPGDSAIKRSVRGKAQQRDVATERPTQPAQDMKCEETNHEALGSGESIDQSIRKVSAQQVRPWSRWFPGDGGRWFYQARLRSDGTGWEYQFTEGYPTISWSRTEGTPSAVVSSRMHEEHPQRPTVLSQRKTTTFSGQLVHYNIGRATHEPLARPHNAIPDQKALPLNATTSPDDGAVIVADAGGMPRRLGSSANSSRARAHLKDVRTLRTEAGAKCSGKKLSTRVNAEKQLKFSPAKKVQKWLNSVDT